MNDTLLLLSNFIKNPKEVGAIVPSSRFLTREIVRCIDFKASKNIVELGPGLGMFTKAILKEAMPSTRIVCLETNKRFYDYLSKNIVDKKLKIINNSAENISSNLRKAGMQEADCIVSGLPFLAFPDAKKKRILDSVKDSMCNDGRFILFQYTNRLGKMLESYFSKVDRSFVPLNVPPAFVYVCKN